eukprot:TCALIF_13895-PA protein Name:"Similar to WIGBRp0010 Putative replication protein (Wigglesworthia glossinidia brevipalpis)" AED:0.14 eAED:0.14 QI:0/-1/0/1/-1/1/1/0/357
MTTDIVKERSPLLPDRHPQRDLFVCDIVDAAPKGDIGSMGHPVFSLSTKPDMRKREYQQGDSFIKVSPSHSGLATIHDRDILIYCISQCIAALNEGRKVKKALRFKARDLLVATNRQVSGQGYNLLKDAFRRLQGTQIETNIRQGGKEYFKVFGLIESAEIIKETRDGKMLEVEVVLSDWVFDAIENKHVLTLSKDYFFLRKPLERKLYELGRKHCGSQEKWMINIDNLREKCGSNSRAKEFKRLLAKIIEDDQEHGHMPDYFLTVEKDNVIFRPKTRLPSQYGVVPEPGIKEADVIQEARKLAPGWDIYHLLEEWRGWVSEKQMDIRDPDAHFLAFCKSRGPYEKYIQKQDANCFD